MIIQSKFKDYYDFVANQYGGGDPKIVYERKRISTTHIEIDDGFPLEDIILADGIDWRYLIVCGKAYIVSRRVAYDDNFFGIGSFNLVSEAEMHAAFKKTGRGYWFGGKRDYQIGIEKPYLIDLSRKVGAPVFIIKSIQTPWAGHRMGFRCLNIFEKCPILAHLGMASLVSPYQMYQDIAYFVGNKLKETPDTNPPVQLSNIQKILKAGFDLKQSFRHRP